MDNRDDRPRDELMSVDDHQLDVVLRDAARTYRVPPPPPLDTIWARVEAETFAAAPRRRGPGWWTLGAAMAACLVIGVLAGRFSTHATTNIRSLAYTADTLRRDVVPASLTTGDPYQRTTEELLGNTAVLLASLPAETRNQKMNARVAEQATQLLTTTRLLMDSPVGADRRMRDLLQDLELVLTQITRLPSSSHEMEMAMITEALTERDVVPRIRSAVAKLAVAEY